MPGISFFHGITIAMFWNERDHPIAHFHAEHAGEVAAIGIDGEVLAGPPPNASSCHSPAQIAHADALVV